MFKVGDIIKCVNNENYSHSLTIDKYYLVSQINVKIFSTVTIINDYGDYDWYYSNRFVLGVKEIRKMKIREICSKSEI